MVVLAVAGSFAFPGFLARLWDVLGRVLDAIAARPRAMVVGFALFGFAWTAGISVLIERPDPEVHDEFGYLLLADTFAHGRLSNPPPPMWEGALETFHVAFEPTYFSKYPALSGVFLAVGQVVFGDPLVGVWLWSALLWGCIAWLLCVALPGRFGVLTAFLGAFLWGGGSYWTHSYWGGAVAASGGALLLGATLRIIRSSADTPARAIHGLLLGVGLSLLAGSRPYEGLVASLPVAVVIIGWLIRRDIQGGVRFRVGLAAAAPLALAATGMGLMNHAVTGDTTRMPYSQHDEIYAVAPQLLLASEREPPEYRHEDLREFWTGFATMRYRANQTVSGYIDELQYTLGVLWRFYLGVFLFIPFFVGVFSVGTRGDVGGSTAPRMARWLIGVVLVAMLFVASRKAHYFAPAAGAVLVLVGHGWRSLAGFAPRRRPVGRALTLSLTLGAAALYGLMFAGYARTVDDRVDWLGHVRARMIRSLEDQGGRHLVVVHHTGDRNLHLDWVFNSADLTEAPVIFARAMGAERDRELAEALGVDHVWSLRVNDGAPDPLVRIE